MSYYLCAAFLVILVIGIALAFQIRFVPKTRSVKEFGPKNPIPTREAVIARANCLATLLQRLQLEMPERDTNERLAAWETMQQSLDSENFSREERRIIASPIGTISHQDTIDCSWRTESLAILRWALSLEQTIRPYDVESKPSFNMEEPASLMVLRPQTEIINARDIAELWHWRARTTQLIQMGRKPSGGYTFERIIRKTVHVANAHGDVPKPIGDDFPALGKPYRDLTQEEFLHIQSIAMERHRAFNWLCGYEKDWDHVPTDT
jgi:hypothetical protein